MYTKVWLRLTRLQFSSQIANSRGAAIFLLFGKLFRLASAFLILYVVVGRARQLAGYSLAQAIFVLALFNFGSTTIQLFFRGVYMFRQKVVDGTFDFYLLNPLSELFYSLFSYTDPLDLLLVIPYGYIVGWAWLNAGYSFSFFHLFLLISSLIILSLFVFSLHVLIIGIGIRYLEVDNTVMLYRDIEKMAAFPIDIYGKGVGGFLTYIMPFALMATIPAKFVFGLTSPTILLGFLLLALAYVKGALWFWQKSLKKYASASS